MSDLIQDGVNLFRPDEWFRIRVVYSDKFFDGSNQIRYATEHFLPPPFLPLPRETLSCITRLVGILSILAPPSWSIHLNIGVHFFQPVSLPESVRTVVLSAIQGFNRK